MQCTRVCEACFQVWKGVFSSVHVFLICVSIWCARRIECCDVCDSLSCTQFLMFLQRFAYTNIRCHWCACVCVGRLEHVVNNINKSILYKKIRLLSESLLFFLHPDSAVRTIGVVSKKMYTNEHIQRLLKAAPQSPFPRCVCPRSRPLPRTAIQQSYQ